MDGANQFETMGERDALRVQAAAVAAQQAALTEEEIRLRQCGMALEKHEKQLAAYLEERRLSLGAWQRRLEQDREALATDRSAVTTERAAVAEEWNAARAERARLAELRNRFKKSWDRKWRDKEVEIARQEQDLAIERQRLAEERAAHQRDRMALHESRLRFNGETELTRRQLQHGWEELGSAQRQWEEGHEREEAELERRHEALNSQTAALAAAEKALERDRESWAHAHAVLMRETRGLEARVGNLRAEMCKLQQDRSALSVGAADVVEPVAACVVQVKPGEGVAAPAVLVAAAGNLADQRRRLLEHWQQMLRTHGSWKDERHKLLVDLQAAHQQLHEQAEDLERQRHEVGVGQGVLKQALCNLAEQRAHLDAWQTELTAREVEWQAERARLLADVDAREEVAETRRQELETLRARWAESRRVEREGLHAARARIASLRRHYGELWHACQKERARLAQGQRQLATRILALERWRHELLPRTQNMPAAEKRLERFEMREASLRAEAEAELGRQEKIIRRDSARLEIRAEGLDSDEAAIAVREEALGRHVAEFELRQADLADAERGREQELARLRQRQEQDQRQIAALREELERIARTLLEDATSPSTQASQAA